MNAFRFARDIALSARATSGPLPAPATHNSLSVGSVTGEGQFHEANAHSLVSFRPFQQSPESRFFIIGVLDRILLKSLICRALQIIRQGLKKWCPLWSLAMNKVNTITTNLKWRLQVILVSNRKVFHCPRFHHHLHTRTGLLEVSDILGIGFFPTTAMLAGVGSRKDDRRLQLEWRSIAKMCHGGLGICAHFHDVTNK